MIGAVNDDPTAKRASNGHVRMLVLIDVIPVLVADGRPFGGAGKILERIEYR